MEPVLALSEVETVALLSGATGVVGTLIGGGLGYLGSRLQARAQQQSEEAQREQEKLSLRRDAYARLLTSTWIDSTTLFLRGSSRDERMEALRHLTERTMEVRLLGSKEVGDAAEKAWDAVRDVLSAGPDAKGVYETSGLNAPTDALLESMRKDLHSS